MRRQERIRPAVERRAGDGPRLRIAAAGASAAACRPAAWVVGCGLWVVGCGLWVVGVGEGDSHNGRQKEKGGRVCACFVCLCVCVCVLASVCLSACLSVCISLPISLSTLLARLFQRAHGAHLLDVRRGDAAPSPVHARRLQTVGFRRCEHSDCRADLERQLAAH